MNKEWSEKNKQIQILLAKETTYKDGIELLIEFRKELFEQISQIVNGYPVEAFYQMPFENVKGYHNKTLSYSIWHIFRIEDIVAHTLIARDEQILVIGDYQKKIGSPIITTGNELQRQDIAEFSKNLNIRALYEYGKEVMLSTNLILLKMEYSRMKIRYSDAYKERLAESGCISPDENSIWLIDYWCDKDIRGLIKMPFSRHWIMHIEAMQRIKNKLCKKARKGVDTIAYCGFSCNHCFLGEWCGSCRTEYNTCIAHIGYKKTIVTTHSDGMSTVFANTVADDMYNAALKNRINVLLFILLLSFVSLLNNCSILLMSIGILIRSSKILSSYENALH